MSGASIGGIPPVRFQRAMVFVDGSNAFQRLIDVRAVLLQDLSHICKCHVEGRQVVREYLYTSKSRLEQATSRHGPFATSGFRIVLGDEVPTSGGNMKEKGVDALLVADLIYHAAMKNYDYALVVSTDTDFVLSLRRVEDFGCRTGVLSLGCAMPARLREACDEQHEVDASALVTNNWVRLE